MKNTIILSSGINKVYEMPFSVMITSLLKNLNRDFNIEMYVIHNDLDKESIAKIQHGLDLNRINFRWIKADMSLINACPTSGHLRAQTYFTCLLPHLLPKSVDKTLFLDADMVVTDDISKLWSIKFDSYLLSPSEAYNNKFCSGVMLINLKKWRKENIGGKAIDLAKKNPNKIGFGTDRDALNIVLQNKWQKADAKWNTGFSKINNEDKIPKGIIHFTGPSKPWHYDFYHPVKEAFKTYFNKTHWKGYKIKEPSIQDRIFLFFLKIIRGVVLVFRQKRFPGYLTMCKVDGILVKYYLMLKSQFYRYEKTGEIEHYNPYTYM